MATISAFKAQLQGGGARGNQFRVDINFPAFVGSLGSAAGNAAQFLCVASSLPSSDVAEVALAFRGRPVYFAGDRSFGAWGVTIVNDTNFLIRNALERWSNGMANFTSTSGIMRPSDYQVDLSVHQLDRNDKVLKSYRFFDAFPLKISDISLSFGESSIEQYSVTFAYNYFVPTN